MDVGSHVTSFNQSECLIEALLVYLLVTSIKPHSMKAGWCARRFENFVNFKMNFLFANLDIQWIKGSTIGYYLNTPNIQEFFLKIGRSCLCFLCFCFFNRVEMKRCSINYLLMTGFEPQTSGVGSNLSTNCATTSAQHKNFLSDEFRVKNSWNAGAYIISFLL